MVWCTVHILSRLQKLEKISQFYLKLLTYYFGQAKGQLLSKSDWRAITSVSQKSVVNTIVTHYWVYYKQTLDSPKKWTDEFVLFAFFTLHGKQIKFIHSFFFWKNLRLANLLFGFIWPLEIFKNSSNNPQKHFFFTRTLEVLYSQLGCRIYPDLENIWVNFFQHY